MTFVYALVGTWIAGTVMYMLKQDDETFKSSTIASGFVCGAILGASLDQKGPAFMMLVTEITKRVLK